MMRTPSDWDRQIKEPLALMTSVHLFASVILDVNQGDLIVDFVGLIAWGSRVLLVLRVAIVVLALEPVGARRIAGAEGDAVSGHERSSSCRYCRWVLGQ